MQLKAEIKMRTLWKICARPLAECGWNVHTKTNWVEWMHRDCQHRFSISRWCALVLATASQQEWGSSAQKLFDLISLTYSNFSQENNFVYFVQQSRKKGRLNNLAHTVQTLDVEMSPIKVYTGGRLGPQTKKIDPKKSQTATRFAHYWLFIKHVFGEC